jgi:hypothetical protein
MNTVFTTTLALAAVLTAPFAHAEDGIYLGAAIGQRSDLTLVTDGTRQDSSNDPRAFSFHGGYELNQHAALEGGYTRFGKSRFSSGASVNMGAMYLAAKGSIALSEKFSLFGKAGVARHTLKLAGTTADDGSYSKTRPMFSAGVAYRVTEQIAITAEAVDYGTLRTGAGDLKMRQLQAGVNFRF